MKVYRKPRRWWEVFLALFTRKPPVERVEFFNPLKLGTGTVVNLDVEELRGLDFRVSAVDEYTRSIGDQSFVHTAYTLVAKPLGAAEVKVRLLVNDNPDATAEDAYTFDVLLLRLLHEQGWDAEIDAAFKEAVETGVFVHEEDGLDEYGRKVREPFRDEYARVGGLRSHFEAEVAEVRDRDRDGVLSPSEVRTRRVRYADFSREVEDAPGVVNTEFAVFEMDASTGYVSIWRGDLTEPSRISAL